MGKDFSFLIGVKKYTHAANTVRKTHRKAKGTQETEAPDI